MKVKMCLILRPLATFIASCVRTLSFPNEVMTLTHSQTGWAGHGTGPPLPGTTQHTAGSSVVVSEV